MLFDPFSSGNSLFELGNKHADGLNHLVLHQLVLVLRIVHLGEQNQLIQQLELLLAVEARILQHAANQLGLSLFFGLLGDRLVDVVDFLVKQQLAFLFLA